ncbi:60S ribosomal protein L3 [Dionaea muscipula]
MAAVSTTFSIKSTSCCLAVKKHYQLPSSSSSSCSSRSFVAAPTRASLNLRSSFLCPPGQLHKLKNGGSAVQQYRRKPVIRVGGLVVKMMSIEAGVGVMGTKLGMMSYFDVDGSVVPVTVVGFREGNIVTQVKTEATDGYNAVQIGYRRVRDLKLTKPELGHLNKSGIIPLRHLQEFRLLSVDGFSPSQKLDIFEIFKEGDLVDVSGTTIGKGFQGGIKRHNFRRGPMSHGSKSHRAPGSIGAGTTPGHVYKGKKMAGRMGGTKVKIRKLKIVKIDNDLNVVMIKGAVPGKPGNLLRIAPAKIVGKNIPKN